MIHGLVRALAVTAAMSLIVVRLDTDIPPESLTGIAIGLLAWSLAVLSLMAGRHQGIKRDPMDPGEATARDLHVPLGLLTLVAAIAHWHPLWRNLSGLLSLGLLCVVVLSLARPGLRRVPGLQWLHRYGAHLLVVMATLHGIQAVFFVQN